jgi:amidohydrolase family protein
MRLLAAAFVSLLIPLSAPLSARADDLPIFDAHIHYSHDAWNDFPVEKAIEILRKAGVKRALVSSSDDAGQRRLQAAAPELIILELRPYRRRGETGNWIYDESVPSYLEDQLKKHRYVGIGEFHVNGADADLPVPRRMVQLAKQYGIFLHAHSDPDAIERLFKQWPQARILWAHAGFAPLERVREMLRQYPNLWCDLSFRTELESGGKLRPDWRTLFIEFPDRFMVGTDTYTPERWNYVVGHAKWARGWLADLPKDVAERIAWKNGETVFGALVR